MKRILLVILAFVNFILADAQFYGNYGAYQYGQQMMQQQQMMNQQAYEYGRNLMQQSMTEYYNNPANAAAITGNALQSIATAWMYNDPESIYEKAFESLDIAGYRLKFANAKYWMGVFAECGLIPSQDPAFAMVYYDDAADQGHSAAKRRLKELKNGADPYSSNQVLTSLQNMVAANTLSYSSSINIPSSSSSHSSSSSSHSSCSLCNGTGVDPTPNSGGSLTSWVAYYNSPGTVCPYCRRSDKHYHDRCPRCNVTHH